MPRARTDVAVVVLDGEAVIHRRGRVHVLDPVATLVWRCCDGTATVPEIVAELAGVFATPADTVGRDVGVAIDQLATLDLLIDPDAPDNAPEPALELLVDPPGSCASCADRTWTHRSAYRVGSRLVAIGTDQARADAAITGALAAHRVQAPSVLAAEPPFFAVELHERPPAGGLQQLDLLHRGATVAARSRRPDQILRALVAQLASYGDLRAAGLAVVNGMVAARDDRAVIMTAPHDTIGFRHALARHGVLVADLPVAVVDPASVEVVVGAPGLDVDLEPINALANEPTDAEPASLPWGRYRLIALGVAGPPSPSTALLEFGPEVGDHRDHPGTIDALLALFESVPVTDAVDPDAIAALLAAG
jgi:hypothetical protein